MSKEPTQSIIHQLVFRKAITALLPLANSYIIRLKKLSVGETLERHQWRIALYKAAISKQTSLRVAIVHPWFLSNGGAEETVNAMAEAFPNADFFTLLFNEAHLPRNLRGREIKASALQWLPWKYGFYRYLLPLYPLLFENIDLRGYDVVITSDSCVAKSVLVDQSAIHLCYCYSPMRCLYDQYEVFRSQFTPFTRIAFKLACHYVRAMDHVAASRVDCLVGVSNHISERIRRCYGLASKIIYPPVDTESGYISAERSDYYLSIGRLTATKHIDLLIAACNLLERRLIVVGTGREANALKKMSGKTIEFRGRVSNEERSDLYAHCRAFLFAPNEDFGIAPVEAQAYGRPVIAYGCGGSLETIIDSVTGIFFDEQTPQSLAEAILKFEAMEYCFDPHLIRRNAQRFGSDVFKAALTDLVAELIEEKKIHSELQHRYTPQAEPSL